MNYKTCWITLNRMCNLRCKWCYAKSTNFLASDDMNLNTAKQIIDICDNLNIKHVILIGGEPTLYNHLFDVIDYCHSKNISCGIVTNGLLLKDETYVLKLKEHKINSISLSLKGENREVFRDITGKDLFNDTIEAVKCCIKNEIKVSLSMVLTEDNIFSFTDGIETMKKIGVNNFHFSFCYDFNITNNTDYLKVHNPRKLIRDFMSIYSKLDSITNHKFTLQNGFPLCLWEENDLNILKKQGQITTICQLLSKSGLIFDSNGYIIPCNAMMSIKFGKLNQDFTNAKELLNYMENQNIKNTYKKLCGVPDMKCLKCELLKNCGGGCVCQWTNYSLNEII